MVSSVVLEGLGPLKEQVGTWGLKEKILPLKMLGRMKSSNRMWAMLDILRKPIEGCKENCPK